VLTNVATRGDGGGAYFTERAELFDTDFISNALLVAYSGGGAVLMDGGSIEGGSFVRNTTPGSEGGGFYAEIFSDLPISGTVFMENSARNEGGGAYVAEDSYDEKTLYLTNTTFVSNTAGDDGGGLYVDYYVELVAEGGRFERNVVGRSGGGLYSAGAYNARARIVGVEFVENSAKGLGGALYVGDENNGSLNVVLEMSGTTFVSNTAGAEGGAAYVARDLTLSDSSFVSNTAVAQGGGLYADAATAITNTEFVSNTAGCSGGGVSMASGSLDASVLRRNVSLAGDGGGVYIASNGAAINNLFAGNTAGGRGDLYAGAALRASHNTFSGTGTAVAAPAGVLTNTLMAGYAMAADADASGVIELRGLLWDGGALTTSGTVTTSNVVVGAAGFVDAAAGNYMAVGDGVDVGIVSGVSEDINGMARPIGGGYDMGAHEAGDANAASLEAALPDGASVVLSPAFVSTTTSYTAALPAGTASVVLTVATSDVSGTVSYASTAGDCVGATCAVAAPGTTTITITVTASDGQTVKTYTIVVTVADDGGTPDATLSDLTIDPGTLSPAFAPTTTAYSAAVANDVTSVNVTATPNDPAATVTFAAAPGTCQLPTARGAVNSGIPCSLEVGTNTITITITASDGTVQEYTITITRAALLTTIDRVWPGTGLADGGMPVRIFGSGFVVALTVTVGPYEGVMASVPFTIESDGRIQFVMPPGTAGQKISVTVATASDAQTAADAFTYVQPDVIEFDGVTGGVFTTTDGVVVTIPPQGVDGMFVITMTPLPPAPGVPGNILMYSFRLDALLNWVPLASLTNPVTIQLPIDENIFAIQDGERPWLYLWVGGEERGERKEGRGERKEGRGVRKERKSAGLSLLTPLPSLLFLPVAGFSCAASNTSRRRA
jgi:hypothetical protein